MRKHRVIAPLALILFSALLFSSCAKIKKDEAYYAEAAKYVYAYTSGGIARDETVRVRFVYAAVGQDKIGQKVSDELFSVSPAIKGEAIWEDDRTIKLQPAEPLPYGERYVARVGLKRLFPDASKRVKIFEFDFSVRTLAFDVLVDGLRAEDPTDLRRQQIVGRISVSDGVDNAALEKVLHAKQGNNMLTATWTHAQDGRTHEFVIGGIERSNARSEVNIWWEGSALGLKKEGGMVVQVPSLDEFVALSARVVQQEEQYVLVNFSDPLSPGQDLAGLVALDGSPSPRYAVDGNFLRVYPNGRVNGWRTLHVEAGVKNLAGAGMKTRSDWPLNFEELKPAVRLVGRGVVVPEGEDGAVLFPFEAVGLRAVDVEVFKIYNSNILQFLQVNDLEGENELERVGKIILQKKIDLNTLNADASASAWQRYAFDLRDMIRQDPGAIYQVRIAFRHSYTLFTCPTPFPKAEDGLTRLGETDDDGQLVSILGGYRGIYFSDSDPWYYREEGDEDAEEDNGAYRWDYRDNPCKREYYHSEHFASRNVFVSDLGITAKRGKDGSVFAAVTDLRTTEPISGVDVEFFNFQLQPIAKVRTDGDGTVELDDLREKPFLVVANRGDHRGYLRLADGSSLGLSRFDVAGVEAQKGLKGYLYGERGVWRPGDSLFLNFVLEDGKGTLPSGHPVQFELSDPKGALQYRTVTSQSVGGVYALHCATRPDAPTGNWTARVQVGGATFTQTLKIETVKPNRLKINLDFGKKQLDAGDESLSGRLSVNWLHGAPGKDLKTKVELQMRAVKTEFTNYRDFVFDDPARSFYSDPQVLFDGSTDANGQATVALNLARNEQAPGKVIASFKVRAFEKSGDFSTDNFALDYFPFPRFVGIHIPSDKYGNRELAQGAVNDVKIVCVDANGRPVANRQVEVGLYRTDWRWWWDSDATSGVGQFNSANHVNALRHETLTTDANGLATWQVNPAEWGRYLIRVSDVEGGHATGDFFWSGYPDNASGGNRMAAIMLPFSVEKPKYDVGEEVTLKVPASESGRILLTLENGTRVVEHRWFEATAGDNFLKFKTTEAMAPAVYAHVSLIQPHAQTLNDLPIRMYGVMPVNVENPKTHLAPQLDMPDAVRPGESFTVSVRETSGKACAYTLALVDEGLLDLTRFETPDPWKTFFAREALGVKTWDMYDFVLGAYGAELDRILGIGGDGINQRARNGAQINRFKPAVVHLGPFWLEKGKTAKHTIKIDNYVGSVRAMLVCSAPAPGGKGAYGSVEKAVPVRKPLMILPTLPRVLGPNETLRLPVDVFAMENKVKSATIRVKENSGLVTIQNTPVNTLNFSQPGEQMTYFNLKVGPKTGVAKFTVTAQGGGETAEETIELLVRNPNPVMQNVWEGALEPGGEWTGNFDANQYSDIVNASLEVSALPPANVSRHLEYLIQYPHGCIEQTTSAAFPQLYADVLAPLSQKQKDLIARNVTVAIEKIRNFQDYSGGFSYWPGSGYVDDWSTTYCGHFLLEAKNKGYNLPEGMLDRWQDFQTKLSRQWTDRRGDQPWQQFDHELGQAYRLYTLALAGKADLAGMNRLREKKDMYAQAAYLLASAYAQAGKPEVARELIGGKWRDDWRYDWCGYTYGSDLRDRSLLLETYTAIGDQPRAQALVNYVCGELGAAQGWYWNTQSLATALRALSKYAGKNLAGQGPAYTYRLGGNGVRNGDASKPVSIVNFTDEAFTTRQVSVKNTSPVRLYARLLVAGQPLVGAETGQTSNIDIAVRYTDTKGNALDASRLPQGADFIAEVTVKRNSGFTFPFNELALNQIFPSGWEILNARMSGVNYGSSSPADYQDVRDDRVYTYFDLTGGNGDTRVYRIQLNAAYAGRYYLPAVSCEAMYDSRVRASVPGRWVEVI